MNVDYLRQENQKLKLVIENLKKAKTDEQK